MKLFQIYETDLESLESSLPELADALGESASDILIRKHLESIKKILSDVRWNYGPHIEVKEREL